MACGLLTPGQQGFASHYATLMLTTEALVSEIPKEEKAPAGMPGGDFHG